MSEYLEPGTRVLAKHPFDQWREGELVGQTGVRDQDGRATAVWVGEGSSGFVDIKFDDDGQTTSVLTQRVVPIPKERF